MQSHDSGRPFRTYRPIRLTLLAFVYGLLGSCQSHPQSVALHPDLSNMELFQKETKFLSLLELLADRPFAGPEETREPLDRAIVEHVRRRTETILGHKLDDQNKAWLWGFGQLFKQQRVLKEGKYSDAIYLGKSILSAPMLSVAIYRTAFSQYLIANVLDKSKTLNTINSLNAYQLEQCRLLCDTIGWKTLAQAGYLADKSYEKILLSRNLFESIGVQRPTWLNRILTETFVTSKKTSSSDVSTLFGRLIPYVRSRPTSEGVLLAQGVLANEIPPVFCHPSRILALHLLAVNARFHQKRAEFFLFQKRLVSQLQAFPCVAEDFAMDEEEWVEFQRNTDLWLARLYWERGELQEAFATSAKVAKEAFAAEDFLFGLEAIQIMIGRVGFEMLSPAENLKSLQAFRTQVASLGGDRTSEIWLTARESLFLFYEGKFSDAVAKLDELLKKTEDRKTKSFALYWKGRALKALGKNTLTRQTLDEIGLIDSLGIYDILAGQLLTQKSGHISSNADSPFQISWSNEIEQVMFPWPDRAFQLFTPSKNEDAMVAAQEQFHRSVFRESLRSATLLTALLRSISNLSSYNRFSDFLRNSASLQIQLLKQEVEWLQKDYRQSFAFTSGYEPQGRQLAWFIHTLGDHFSAIKFVSDMHERTNIFSDGENSFLYFVLYPRPFETIVQQNAQRCAIDPDLIWAVARQESLFQTTVVSGAGAIGLMQLMPTTARKVLARFPEFQTSEPNLRDPETNILAGSCYLSDLIKRYKGNLAHSLAAYNAGEAAVDRWVLNRDKIGDIPFFIEFIPYGETQNYVQKVLRNYYNLKWIYSSSSTH